MGGTGDQPTVAVLGCGLMGSAVARALSRGGNDLVVWNRTPARAEALVQDGIRAAGSAKDAVAAADIVFSVVTDNHALREALGDQASLGGRTLVNLTTGSPVEAAEMQTWVHERGGEYLDGVLGAFPDDIGQDYCVVYYAGPNPLYEKVAPVLRALGGKPRYVSESVGGASVLDVGLVGLFVMPMLTAYAEAVAYVTGRGVGIDVLRQALAEDLGLLQYQLGEILTAVETGNHETDQATVDTWAHAADTFLDEARSAGSRARLLEAATEAFRDVRRAGLGDRAISAVAALDGEGR